jgi:transglutaminase/protease-like cytokinesis protein 3
MKKWLFLCFIVIQNLCTAQKRDFDTIDFTKANNIVKLNYGHSLENLPLLAYELTSKLDTDVEKFRAIYLWVCQNIKVDANQGNRVLSKRERLKYDSISFKAWNNKYLKNNTFKRLIKQKKAVCTGFAYLIKELCFLVNIDCEIVNGFARTATTNTESLELANHSWNAVNLNNKWYLVDAIWACGYIENGRFIKDYNDGYFLADPVLFAKSHYPLKNEWLLNDELEHSEFYASPIIYGETFKHNIIPEYPKELITEVEKNESIKFQFKELKDCDINKIKLVQYIGENEHNLKIEDIENNNDTITFTSKLKHKGWYDIHLKLNNDIVATYTFKVHSKENAQ